MADWNAAQYLKFKSERTQPVVDLINRIMLTDPMDILDVGCGPGNSTSALRTKFPNAEILGIDNSKNMIDTANTAHPNLKFMLCDAQTGLNSIGKKFDIILSNACIQWIPNHAKLLKTMMGLLKDGGILAIQTPMNYEEPIHKIISQTVSDVKWHKQFNSQRLFYNLTQSEYFDVLSDISVDFTIWQTTYFHRLKSHADIMEWYRGTGLRPYLEALSEKNKINFEHDIFEKVKKEYPVQVNGEIIFRFPRLFFTATNRN